ncbi:hypothetical protein, partial [Aureimonas ureilytica]
MSQPASIMAPLDLSGPALLAGTPGHGDALVLGATRLLAAGRPEDAFLLADRACRLSSPPPAPSLALRALSLWRMGEKTEAVADLSRALTGDPGDPVVARAALQLSAGGAEMPDPCDLLVQTVQAHDLLRLSVARLLASGRPALARLDVMDRRLTGWLIWAGNAASVELSLEGSGERTLAAQPDFPLAPPGARGTFIDLALSCDVHRWTLGLPGETEPLTSGALWPRSSAAVSPLEGRAPDLVPARRPITILVPVFEDFEATQDCLRAAVAAKSESVRVLVVDDASPNRRLKLLLDALAARGLI